MLLFSNIKDRKAAIKSLSGLSVNLSAAWFGAAFITPNFSHIVGLREILLLIYDIIFGILFLLMTFKLERSLL